MDRNRLLDPESQCESYRTTATEWGKGYSYQECSHSFGQRTRPRSQQVLVARQIALVSLAAKVEELSRRVEELESRPQSHSVPINTFAPKPFEAIRPIMVLVEPVVDESGEPSDYIATFPDGAISVTGDTIEEAVSLLKDRMVAQYKRLAQRPRVSLGRIPQQQLDALQGVMRRTE